jgi:hypothetical protein
MSQNQSSKIQKTQTQHGKVAMMRERVFHKRRPFSFYLQLNSLLLFYIILTNEKIVSIWKKKTTTTKSTYQLIGSAKKKKERNKNQQQYTKLHSVSLLI